MYEVHTYIHTDIHICIVVTLDMVCPITTFYKLAVLAGMEVDEHWNV